jgi:peptide/nickel transport system substrate-binding protein
MRRSKIVSISVSLAMLALTATMGYAPAQAAGKAGGTITIGVPGLPPSQGNPFKEGPGTPGIHTYAAMFDALVRVDGKGAAQPKLALSWKPISKNSWRFNLRKGVKFSNGEIFDANAVKATVDFLVSPDGRRTVIGSTELPELTSARVVNANVIDIYTKNPDAILPAKLAAMFIVAPKAWKDAGQDVFSKAPVGTGPFKVDSISTTRIEMSAFKNSWRKPKADKLVIIPLADAASRLQALQSGQVNMLAGINPDQIETAKSSQATVITVPAPQVMSLAFTVTKGGPVADVRVRQALNFGVDKAAIANSLLAGRGKAATQGVTPTVYGFNKSVTGYPYNPTKAKELLTAAGYPNGLTIAADITVGSFPSDNLIYQAVKSDLAKIGVTLNYTTITFAQWLPQYNANSWKGDAFGLSWNSAPRGDASRPYAIFVCKTPGAFYCNAEEDALVKKAATELNAAKRLAILEDLAVRVTANAPALYLVEQIDLYALGKGVAGFSVENRAIAYERITVK